MRLLRAELARLCARRFSRMMAIALLLALGVIAVVVAYNTHRPSAEELQRAETEAADARLECQQAQESLPERERWDCGEIEASQYVDYMLNFQDQMPELMLGLGGLLALIGFLVGASFIGAEWSSGGLANLLLWRTQRISVLFAKLGAMLLALTVTGVLVGAAWVATIWFIASTRGEFGDLTEGFWISLGWDGARAIGLALVAALTGMSIASLGRRTAAALGVLIGYIVVWEIGARLVMEGLRVRLSGAYMLSTYVGAWLAKEVELFDYRTCYEMDCDPYILKLTWPWAALVLGGLAALCLLVSAVSFQRRDVT
ncbi:MAG: ABC transporter permease subunit [Micromonosporaceae bacterium]